MNWDRNGFKTPEVALPASAIQFRIAVQNLLPESAVRNANAVVVPRDGSKIENHDDRLMTGFPSAHEADYAAVCIVAIDPFESRWPAVQEMQCGFLAI